MMSIFSQKPLHNLGWRRDKKHSEHSEATFDQLRPALIYFATETLKSFSCLSRKDSDHHGKFNSPKTTRCRNVNQWWGSIPLKSSSTKAKYCLQTFQGCLGWLNQLWSTPIWKIPKDESRKWRNESMIRPFVWFSDTGTLETPQLSPHNERFTSWENPRILVACISRCWGFEKGGNWAEDCNLSAEACPQGWATLTVETLEVNPTGWLQLLLNRFDTTARPYQSVASAAR